MFRVSLLIVTAKIILCHPFKVVVLLFLHQDNTIQAGAFIRGILPDRDLRDLRQDIEDPDCEDYKGYIRIQVYFLYTPMH